MIRILSVTLDASLSLLSAVEELLLPVRIFVFRVFALAAAGLIDAVSHLLAEWEPFFAWLGNLGRGRRRK